MPDAGHTGWNYNGSQASTTIKRIIPDAGYLIMSSFSTTLRPHFIEVDRTFGGLLINNTVPNIFIIIII